MLTAKQNNTNYNEIFSDLVQTEPYNIYNPALNDKYSRTIAFKEYELKDHLGNVTVVVDDYKTPKNPLNLSQGYTASFSSYTNYYAFGMMQPGRNSNPTNYRFGFNGKENDNEVKGVGNQQDYGFRIYDPRIAKFLSVDPITKDYPELTPYQFASNTPIMAIDIDGLEGTVPLTPLGFDYKTFVSSAFASTFSASLPKKLIYHYANGGGAKLKLSYSELVECNIISTGLQGLSPQDQASFRGLLSNKNAGESFNIVRFIEGGALTGGTLGRFTIKFEGNITIDANDSRKWSYSGTSQISDTYDFDPENKLDGGIERSDWGNQQTKIASLYLPGKKFDITSDVFKVNQQGQKGKNTNVDIFNGYIAKDVPNKLANNIDIREVINDVSKAKATNGQ